MTEFFGTQHFKTSDPDNDKQIVYQFSSKKDLQIWMQADMSPYNPEKVDKQYTRQSLTAKQAKTAIEKNASLNLKEFKTKGDFTISGAYLHIRHPDEKYKHHFGVVVKFNDDKQLKSFMERNNSYYGENATKLKNTDKRVVAANVNGAAMLYKDEKSFDSQVKMALSAYPQLDPSKNHLVMISQKGDGKDMAPFSKPEVYSFSTKSYRDFFANRINGAKGLPIRADKLANFHPIAIDHAIKGKMLQGTLSEHFRHKDEYLSLHNSADKKLSAVASKQAISQDQFISKIQQGDKDFTSLDLRSIDFKEAALRFNLDNLNKSSFKDFDFSNSSFSGQKLDGINFSGITAKGADFSKTSLNGTKFDGADLDQARFKNAAATREPASFKAASLTRADFKYADMPKADLRDANLVRTNFYKSNLKEMASVGAKLSGAEFNGCNLENAMMDKNPSAYNGVSFKDANLKGTGLETSMSPDPQKEQAQAAAMGR